MPAHPGLQGSVATEMVRYIRSLASGGAVLPPAGTARLDRHQPGETGAYVLTARYVDRARNASAAGGDRAGGAPLAARARRGARGRRLDRRGAREGGRRAERPLATAYASGAYLRFGPTDLTGVGGVRLALQSLGTR
jgi:hypothetical protein